MTDGSCVFCGILAGEIPGTFVAQEDAAAAFMDVNPATPGHLLVVPRTHVPDLFGAAADDLSACLGLAQRMARLVRDRLAADGVTIMQSNGRAAWQTVFHLHLHVIPRYDSDALVLPWKPAPGDPDAIAATARRLTAS